MDDSSNMKSFNIFLFVSIESIEVIFSGSASITAEDKLHIYFIKFWICSSVISKTSSVSFDSIFVSCPVSDILYNLIFIIEISKINLSNVCINLNL